MFRKLAQVPRNDAIPAIMIGFPESRDEDNIVKGFLEY
jgi:hypothetical protein